MAITIGQQLGSYEITALLGKGGMGEVYRARDAKLKRDVAIKILPDEFSLDPERVSRFQREAEALAAINHQNIGAIYDLQQVDSTRFLILELVEGDTLAGLLVKRGALPIDEVLNIAKQICEALEAAHEKGVVHRDLKPANIKLTSYGKVKVLDFGLAKAMENARSSAVLSHSPTMVSATMGGVILGTAAYMSPEQAAGKHVDRRTDIWALGCVLYELLTGRQAFSGDTVTEILAAVLKSEPEWSALPEATPLHLRSLLRRCLQKEANKRLRDAADVHIEMEDFLSAPATLAQPPIAITPRPLWRQAMPSVLTGIVVAVVALGIAILNRPAPAPQPVSRMVITLPAGDHLPPAEQRALALSPDGKLLAYVAVHDAVQQLYLRAIDGFEAKAVAGTEGATAPFFSPDSQWIGFHAAGKVKKLSIGGGAVVTLSDASALTFGHGASWGDNDTIAFQTENQGGLSQVSAAGGAAQRLTALSRGELIHRWPDFLPGGKTLLLSANSNNVAWNVARLAAYVSGTGQWHDLNLGGVSPHYATTGHLVFVQAGTLMAAPFDGKRLEVRGSAVPVVEGVLESLTSGNAQYAVSAGTGSLAYVSGGIQGTQNKLVWVGRNGMEQPVAAPARSYVFPRLSPDGRQVAVAVSEQETQVWTYDLGREALTRLTFEGNLNFNPQWTPDGKRIAFYSNRAGPITNIFWQLADGSGGIERLTTSEFINSPASFSPDGQLLAYVEINPTTGYDISVLRLSDPSAGSGQSRKPQVFLRTPFTETAPKFSPDGHWLAYASNESGTFEIYVQSYPGPGGKWQISTGGGMEPVWKPNGGELFYRSGTKMMVVDVETKSGLSVGKPRLLFDAGSYSPTPATYPNYDVSPDGRFLMLKPSEQQGQAATQINVVLNWFTELQQRVPLK
jgi:eukaryotic-like serine/threonine-protein kinase